MPGDPESHARTHAPAPIKYSFNWRHKNKTNENKNKTKMKQKQNKKTPTNTPKIHSNNHLPVYCQFPHKPSVSPPILQQINKIRQKTNIKNSRRI
jgi:hypothetical protein